MTAERSTGDVVPPNDLDAEAAVISSAILDPNTYTLVADRLTPGRFFSEANRRIWEAIGGVVADGLPLDLVTVKGRLADAGRLAQVGGAAYLANLVDAAPSTSHPERYADRIAELARLRDLIVECRRFAASAPEHAGDVQVFLETAAGRIRAIADTADTQTMRHVGDVLREKFRGWTLEDAGRTKLGVRTGFADLDAMINGWKPTKLYLLAARPGVGKSAFALNTATSVAGYGGGVAFFSLEMGRDELTDRQLAAISGVPLSAVENIKSAPEGPETDRRLAALAVASQGLSIHPLWIDDRGSIGLADVRARSKKVHDEIKRHGGTGLALVVVDYCQLMQEPTAARSREQAVAANARGLKLFAKDFDNGNGVAVLLLSQMNRDIEKRAGTRGAKPKLSDLRESGSLEQDSDVVMFLHRDEDGQRRDGPTELIVAKQRNGPAGTVELYYRGHITRFDSMQRGAA